MQVRSSRAVVDRSCATAQRSAGRTRRCKPARYATLRRSLAVLVLVACALLGAGTAAQAKLLHKYTSQITGEKATKPFAFLCGLNISPATGELFAADAGKVDVFDATNAFLRKVGKRGESEAACSTAVNDTTQTLYVANPGEGEPERPSQQEVVFVYKLVAGKYELQQTLNGSNTPAKTFEGFGTLEFGLEAGSPLHVAVAQKSAQVNSEDVYVSVGGFQGVVDQFNSAGEYLKQIVTSGEPQSMAVGPAGELYVAVEGEADVINEYNPAGELIAQNDGGGAGGFGTISGLALDAAGDLYVSDSTKEAVDQFDPSGNFQGRITGSETPAGRLAQPLGVAVNQQNGSVYVADHTVEEVSVADVFAPATIGAAPFLEGEGVTNVTATGATLQAEVDPTGVPTSYRFEYGRAGDPLTGSAETSLGAGQTILHPSLDLSGLLANTSYEYRVVVTPSGHAVETGKLLKFTTRTEGSSLTLPDGRAWELVSPVNKFGSLLEGAGGEGVAQTSLDGSRITYSAASPLEANPAANAGHAQVLSVRGAEQWSTSEIVPPTYLPTGPGPLAHHGLQNRIYSSDLTRSIVDPFREEPALSPLASERTPYLRNLNLTGSACQISETACYVPLATATGELADVTSGVKFGGGATGPAGGVGAIIARGATPDLKHVLLESLVPLKNPEPTETANPLYEWSAESPPAQRLQLVSVYPTGEGGAQVPAADRPHFGVQRGNENSRHAISDSGSRVVFSAAPLVGGSHTPHLYLRDTQLGQTVRLDPFKEETEAPVGLGPTYQTASTDASTIFFSDEQRLTPDSTAALNKPDLYACHVKITAGQVECKPEDLTTTDKNAGESPAVQGLVIEAGESGSDVYFVANGVLSSNANQQGEEAKPGQCGENPPDGATCNLYREHFNGSSWDEPIFIAALSGGDAPDWAAFSSGTERLENGRNVLLSALTARVSPNGQYLAFMSDRRLTDYDNTDASPSAGGAADEEVFLYDSGANSLTCPSCNPTGQRPHGLLDTISEGGAKSPLVDPANDRGNSNVWEGRWLAGNIPGWSQLESSSALYQSRYLSDEGRLFFNSADALGPQDKNSVEDVYQYEHSGVGNCATSPACLSLISSGESSNESAFVDASKSGDDVFFLTTSKLLTQDVDQSYDLYDAHNCNLSPCLKSPQPASECSSAESCQGNSSSSTNFALPAMSSTPGVAPVTPPVTPQGKTLPSKTTKPTRAQLLKKALKSCNKLKKQKRRLACRKAAMKKYGPKAKKKSKKAGRR